MGPWYTTRERVLSALDASSTVRTADQVDDAIAAATPVIDDLCLRSDGFVPWTGTLRFDSPAPGTRTWALDLDDHWLVGTPTAITVDGVAVTVSDVLFYPLDNPPYERLVPKPASLTVLRGIGRGSVAITGTWAHSDVQRSAGALSGGINDSTTTLTLTGAGAAVVGIGSVLTIGTERVTVTGRQLVSTAQTVLAPGITASHADTGIPVTTGSAYAIGEILMIDTERVRVSDIAGNTLVVDRAIDGTVLAAHNGSTIYASRTFTVVRADRGTTAAAHLDAATVTVLVVEPLVSALARALAENTLLSEQSGYARTIGSGEATRNASGAGLQRLMDQVQAAYGRTLRHRAV